MLRNSLLLAAFITSVVTPAFSAEMVARLLPSGRIVGEGKLSVAFWDVYDASLYAPDGKFSDARPFVLSLRYMRALKGEDIADRSILEMREQGYSDEDSLSAWHQKMKEIFPDVENGTVLSALFIPGEETIFYNGDRQIGIVRDAEFTRWFSNIWLGLKTSEPDLRHKLLGLS